MDRNAKLAPSSPPPTDRRAELFARLESALRSEATLRLEEGPGGFDPYNTTSGPKRRDAWGAKAR